MPSTGSRTSPEPGRRLTSDELRFLTDEIGAALGNITSCVDAIRDQGFSAASRNLLGTGDIPFDPLVQIEALSDHLTGCVSGHQRSLLRKVIEETLLSLAGLDYDLNALDPDRGASRYFRDNEPSDLLLTLLDLYVSDAVWIGMDGELSLSAPQSEPIEQRRTRIDAMSRGAVRRVLAELHCNGDLSKLIANPSMGRTLMTRLREVLARTDLPHSGQTP